ncbi:MAG: hypothetical protein EPN92_13745 [Chitinophagaceae bacterium]|nr:MAG: hypothetical protein EPN92_13745 [Chitinophagaceae bacterium]
MNGACLPDRQASQVKLNRTITDGNTKSNFKLIAARYHIVITRKNNALLSFLKIRAIVNGTDIYPLPSNKPVIIPLDENNPKIVVTDGYHFTKPLELVYHHIHTYYFKVVCAIDDFQLWAGIMLMGLLYLVGFLSGFFILKLFSFFPIVYFLFLYYINRHEFIQLRVT